MADLAFPVTSDADEVKSFFSGAGNRVVFATYQSSLVIAAAQADPAIPAFDLAVADEAHRCAGKVGSDFTAILDNAQIRSTKRLFATATPRTYSSTVHKAAEDRGVEVVGMDNAALFGEVLYALPFGKAIERKLLTDYRVVIIGVDDPTIAQWIAKRELVSTGTGIETDSESLAAQIGLLKAIKDYDLKRIISFHSRVNRAEDFTTDMQNTMQWISDEHRPSGTLRTDFVSGNMSASKRKIKLDQLKALSADERGVLSNARCLSEGVDVPSLDGVAFIDPRSSQVDIIQAVGRAIRLSPDKKAGTIVLPVFIAAGDDAASTIEASNFKPIWEVLDALKAHDDVLACELDQIRTEMGRKPGAGVSADGLRKISIDLPATVDTNFSSALRTYLVEQVTASWDERYGQLLVHKAEHGHVNVSTSTSLGIWVGKQRQDKRKGVISAERVRLLDELYFLWEPFDSKWEEKFRELVSYKTEHGNVNIPRYHSSGLGAWVHNQRQIGKNGSLSKDRIRRLDEIGFEWTPSDLQWNEQFEKLSMYKAKHGHLNFPDRSSTRLGLWMLSQRQNRRNGRLTTERIRLLDEIEFEWVPFGSAWNERFNKLIEYKAKFGSVDVPKKPITDLGTWVSVQRGARNKREISEERIRLLDEIGFIWDAHDFRWEEMFKELCAYKKSHGHLNIPTSSTGLGSWVHIQRRAKRHRKLSEEKIKRLDEIGFAWEFVDSGWEDQYNELVVYGAKYGNLSVPVSLTVLRNWVSKQRASKRKGELPKERVQLLDQIGFDWNPPMSPPPRKNTDADWLLRYEELLAYKTTYGNTNVLGLWATGLGRWAGTQRQARKNGKLSEERTRLLEEIGFEWVLKSGRK